MSSIVKGYNYDIFISYRQKDNKGDRWVSEFVEALKIELESTFKEEISVYFDINPHDGLLETHDVDASLKEKLKCLIFIPIISRTYCDPKSFAWEHEFRAFVEMASKDRFGLKVKLTSGNVAGRVLPVRIHDLDNDDIKLCESVLGGVLRGVEFIYKESGVNRPLRSVEDNPHDNLNHTVYRNQVNKVALAIKEILVSIQVLPSAGKAMEKEQKTKEITERETTTTERPSGKAKIRRGLKVPDDLTRMARQGRTLRNLLIFLLAGIILTGCITVIKLVYTQKKKDYARNEILPEIQKLVDNNFTPPYRAFELANEAEKYIPGDSILIQLWPKISGIFSLQSQPEGANVFWKDYDHPEDPWKLIGTTPVKNFRFPFGYKRIKIEKDGFDTILLTTSKPEMIFFMIRSDTWAGVGVDFSAVSFLLLKNG